MDIKSEIKTIEKEEARLAKKKKELLQKKKEVDVQEAKLESLVKNSGFTTAKSLVEALVAKFGIRISSRKKAAGKQRKRTRTRVTKELRDTIRKDVTGGMSMNAASKKYQVSYIVVSKIMKGAYDKLK